MSARVLKRLRRELQILIEESPIYYSAGPVEDDLMKWEATIVGPEDSPYEDGIFELSIDFPQEYPFNPPTVKFKTVIYHPNISMFGNICLYILNSGWSPAMTISQVLLGICALLCDPNPDDPLSEDVASVFKNDRAKFDDTARKWTRRYAMA